MRMWTRKALSMRIFPFFRRVPPAAGRTSAPNQAARIAGRQPHVAGERTRGFRFGVRARFFAGFGAALVLMLAVSAMAYASLRSVTSAAHELGSAAELERAAMAVRLASLEGLDIQSRALIGGGDWPVRALRTAFDRTMADALVARDILEAAPGEATAAGSGALTEALDDLDAGVRATLDLVEREQHDAARKHASAETSLAFNRVEMVLAGLEEEVRTTAETAMASASATQRSATRTLLVMSLVAVTATGALAVLLSRGIVRGIGQLATAAAGIARGDIEQHITVSGRDEVGDTARAFKEMVGYLGETAEAARRIAQGDLTVVVAPHSDRDALGHAFAEMVSRLHETMAGAAETADNVSVARGRLEAAAEQSTSTTQELAVRTREVARRSNEQAEHARQVDGAVRGLREAIAEIVAGTVAQSHSVSEATVLSRRVADAAEATAGNAEAAALGAREAADTARAGAEAVQAAVERMTSIQRAVDAASGEVASLGERSAEIGTIVGVIKDIAEQTNLLALNAAIEAARAGEQGRGFAVVAEEVRRLADRVSSATSDIAALIGSVQSGVSTSVSAMQQGDAEVDGGASAVAEAGRALDRILQAVEQVSVQIEQIAETSRELRASGQEMASGIETIDAVVQRTTVATASMSETATSAAEAVATIAEVAEENSAATLMMSAGAEEMSAHAQEVMAATHQLGSMADELRGRVVVFTLRPEPADERPSDEARAA